MKRACGCGASRVGVHDVLVALMLPGLSRSGLAGLTFICYTLKYIHTLYKIWAPFFAGPRAITLLALGQSRPWAEGGHQGRSHPSRRVLGAAPPGPRQEAAWEGG